MAALPACWDESISVPSRSVGLPTKTERERKKEFYSVGEKDNNHRSWVQHRTLPMGGAWIQCLTGVMGLFQWRESSRDLCEPLFIGFNYRGSWKPVSDPAPGLAAYWSHFPGFKGLLSPQLQLQEWLIHCPVRRSHTRPLPRLRSLVARFTG